MPDRYTVSAGRLYPLHDNVPGSTMKEHLLFRAQWTGEKRPPRAGEWYLSGAVVEAYRALSNQTTTFHIARIVRVRIVTQEVIEELVSGSIVVSGRIV